MLNYLPAAETVDTSGRVARRAPIGHHAEARATPPEMLVAENDFCGDFDNVVPAYVFLMLSPFFLIQTRKKNITSICSRLPVAVTTELTDGSVVYSLTDNLLRGWCLKFVPLFRDLLQRTARAPHYPRERAACAKHVQRASDAYACPPPPSKRFQKQEARRSPKRITPRVSVSLQWRREYAVDCSCE